MDERRKWKLEPATKRLVLVEGTHDKDFVEQLIKDRNLGAISVQVMPLGGKSELRQNLKLIKLDSYFSQIESLVVLRDADSVIPDTASGTLNTAEVRTRSAALRTFDAVKNALTAADLPAPVAHGTIVPGPPRVGVFIFPDGRSDGMLESLCKLSLTSHVDASCVSGFLDCVRGNRANTAFSPKAWTQAFIAVQSDPDVQLGKAAKKGYLPMKHEAFDGLTEFLATAFDVTGTERPTSDGSS